MSAVKPCIIYWEVSSPTGYPMYSGSHTVHIGISDIERLGMFLTQQFSNLMGQFQTTKKGEDVDSLPKPPVDVLDI